MVNNTAEELRPFFMTADHCNINAGNAASLVVCWNYENPTCRPVESTSSGTPYNGSLNQNQTGATLRASSSTSDFTLVELDSMPMQSYGIYWAGWDARAIEATSAVCVHHPRGHAKRISFENQPTTSSSYI